MDTLFGAREWLVGEYRPVFLALLGLGYLGDILTTRYFVREFGIAHEGNPLVSLIIRRYGWTGYFCVHAAMATFLIYEIAFRGATPVLLAVLFGFLAVNNLVLIVRLHSRRSRDQGSVGADTAPDR
jgi:hypothetical protein